MREIFRASRLQGSVVFLFGKGYLDTEDHQRLRVLHGTLRQILEGRDHNLGVVEQLPLSAKIPGSDQAHAVGLRLERAFRSGRPLSPNAPVKAAK